jgi:hypothetical protein
MNDTSVVLGNTNSVQRNQSGSNQGNNQNTAAQNHQQQYLSSLVNRRLSTGIKYKTKRQRVQDGVTSQHNDNDEGLDDDQCAICFCDMSLPFRTSCSHQFCFMCLKSVFGPTASSHSNTANCPLCRAVISFAEFEKFAKVSENDFLGDLEGDWVWKYSGRNGGWWLFEPQHYSVLEESYRDFVTWQLEERKKQLEELLAQQQQQQQQQSTTDSSTTDSSTTDSSTTDSSTTSTQIPTPNINPNDQILVQLDPLVPPSQIIGSTIQSLPTSSSTNSEISTASDATVAMNDDSTNNETTTTTDNNMASMPSTALPITTPSVQDADATTDAATDTTTDTTTDATTTAADTTTMTTSDGTDNPAAATTDGTDTSAFQQLVTIGQRARRHIRIRRERYDGSSDDEFDRDEWETDYSDEEYSDYEYRDWSETEDEDDGSYTTWLENYEREKKEAQAAREAQFNQVRYCKLQIGATTYIVDFIDMNQYPIDMPNRKRKVKREQTSQAGSADTKGVSGVAFTNRQQQYSQPTSQARTAVPDAAAAAPTAPTAPAAPTAPTTPDAAGSASGTGFAAGFLGAVAAVVSALAPVATTSTVTDTIIGTTMNDDTSGQLNSQRD